MTTPHPASDEPEPSLVRPALPEDAEAWAAMRYALWPDGSLGEHAEEIAAWFEGHLPELAAALMAVNADGAPVGFAELGERPFAEGCDTRPVAYLEGWFVAPDARGLGVGRALIAAAERWAADRGYRELASDTQWDNDASVAAHQALGFEPAGVIRCFRKRLHAHAAPAHHPQP